MKIHALFTLRAIVSMAVEGANVNACPRQIYSQISREFLSCVQNSIKIFVKISILPLNKFRREPLQRAHSKPRVDILLRSALPDLVFFA
jgi:hypothetical protein